MRFGKYLREEATLEKHPEEMCGDGPAGVEGLPGTENSDAKAEMRKSKKFKNCATGVARGKHYAGSGKTDTAQ